jgi:hypothetical protein
MQLHRALRLVWQAGAAHLSLPVSSQFTQTFGADNVAPFEAAAPPKTDRVIPLNIKRVFYLKRALRSAFLFCLQPKNIKGEVIEAWAARRH